MVEGAITGWLAAGGVSHSATHRTILFRQQAALRIDDDGYGSSAVTGAEVMTSVELTSGASASAFGLGTDLVRESDRGADS